jgi:hypothetical protein
MIRFIASVLLLTLLLGMCAGMEAPPFGVPEGYMDKEEHFDKNGFQDYTDYCKYYYDSAEAFESNAFYEPVTDDDIENIRSYFMNFRFWMMGSDRLNEYDFNSFCITSGDYVRIITKEGQPIGDTRYGKFDNYTVYFFDTDTCTLYYIHGNI